MTDKNGSSQVEHILFSLHVVITPSNRFCSNPWAIQLDVHQANTETTLRAKGYSTGKVVNKLASSLQINIFYKINPQFCQTGTPLIKLHKGQELDAM